VDFDCVIVSAGAVGSVLANRLSEDPDYRVPLLESGGCDTSPMVSVPERLCDLDSGELIASLDAVIRAGPAVHYVRVGTAAGSPGLWRQPG
jgi:choline dehydrogenase-like flavoprotein